MVRGGRWWVTYGSLLLVFLVPYSACAQASTSLTDIPPVIADYLVLRVLLPTLAEAQIAIIDHFLQNAHVPEGTASQMRHYRGYAEAALQKPLDEAAVSFAEPIHLPELGLWLSDPRQLAARMQTLKMQVRTACAVVRLVQKPDPPSTAQEGHNFLVFYLRNVHRVCGDPVDWRPQMANSPVQEFFSMFSTGRPFKTLHDYLENLHNQPFMRPEEFFTVMYFYYLRLAFEARHINMVYRELLGGRPDVWQRFPETRYVRNLLSLLLAAKWTD